MPVVRFFVVLCIVVLAWVGIVQVSHQFGMLTGFITLVVTIIVGRYLSKQYIVRLKAKQPKSWSNEDRTELSRKTDER